VEGKGFVCFKLPAFVDDDDDARPQQSSRGRVVRARADCILNDDDDNGAQLRNVIRPFTKSLVIT
jgi:hypothetical protein